MKSAIRSNRNRSSFRPGGHIVVPDPLDSWSAEDVELLLWPDTPEHLPVRQPEEGWPQLLGF